MMYVGHFSFAFESKTPRKAAQPWHGNFTAVVEARNVAKALKKLAKLVKSSASSELFSDVSEVYLEACVQIKSVPHAGFIGHVTLEEGETIGSISMTLPDVSRRYASSFHFEPDAVDKDGGFEPEPFLVLKKKPAAKKAKPAPKKTKPTKKR